MPDRPDIYVRLAAVKFLFRHGVLEILDSSLNAHNAQQTGLSRFNPQTGEGG
jgi:hypothetical protein